MGDDLQTEAVAEINVTPMIDVLLSLLIIFMVAAKPPPKHKQPIAIPKDPIEQTENDPNATLLIKIDAAGLVSVFSFSSSWNIPSPPCDRGRR